MSAEPAVIMASSAQDMESDSLLALVLLHDRAKENA